MLTLEQFSKDYLRQSMLMLAGLPDTEEGNEALKEIITQLFESEEND